MSLTCRLNFSQSPSISSRLVSRLSNGWAKMVLFVLCLDRSLRRLEIASIAPISQSGMIFVNSLTIMTSPSIMSPNVLAGLLLSVFIPVFEENSRSDSSLLMLP